jgi:trehalose 6-phosphate synthase/phosphatase
LGHLNLSFVAEHGVFIRFKGEPWKAQLPISTSWKKVVRPILELYVTRCAGSLIEEKKNTLTWHYRNTHPGLGFVRSRELLNSLLQLTANTPIQVIDGNKVLEIRLMGVDKGSTSLKIIDHFLPDYVICVGDDTTDEDMFKSLEGKATTIKVGQGNTAAKFNIQTQQDVLPFFRRLLT